MLFIGEEILSKLLLNVNSSVNIKNVFVKKWLISGSYNHNVFLIQNQTPNLSKNVDFYSSKYENVIAIGDFNAEVTNNYLEGFCLSHDFKSLIKERKCAKNLEIPIRFKPHFNTSPKSFHSSGVYEIGLSDFHK